MSSPPLVYRICERCKATTEHKIVLDGKHHECKRCRKVTPRYDLRARSWAGV